MDSTTMSDENAHALTERVSDWILGDGSDHAVLLLTVDGYLRPHVALLARDEIAIPGPKTLRVAVGAGSRSAENLRLRSTATLCIYDADLACVVKTRAVRGPQPLGPGSLACELEIEDVRFDTPRAEEGAAHLVSGLRFEGRPARPDIRVQLLSWGA